MQNNQKKELVNCPICNHSFIPEAFHIEKVIMDTMEHSSKVHIISDKEVIRNLEIKPFNLLRKAWVTNCPQCNFILRFTAELAKKELIEIEGRKISSYSEFGTNHTYNLYNFSKPYMDYADYMNETIIDIKSKIQNALQEINIEELGKLCRDFMTDKNIDAFKFLIRFYNILENYCNSVVMDFREKDMHQKIKESSFPQQLEASLDGTRKIRNKIVHESYDLTQDDAEQIKNTFLSYLYYLVSTKLVKLNPKELIEKIDYEFIDKNGLLWEVRRFLHVNLGEILKFKGYYENLLIPLLVDLGIQKN
jgi:hypothetical protein